MPTKVLGQRMRCSSRMDQLLIPKLELGSIPSSQVSVRARIGACVIQRMPGFGRFSKKQPERARRRHLTLSIRMRLAADMWILDWRSSTSLLSPALRPISLRLCRLDEAILYPSLRAKQSRVTFMGRSLTLPSLHDKLYGGGSIKSIDRTTESA